MFQWKDAIIVLQEIKSNNRQKGVKIKVRYCEESIAQNLKDAGCDETIIKVFLCDLQAGNQVQANKLLQKHRCSLLSELHKDQKRIDCLDYLIFMLQKSKNDNVQN